MERALIALLNEIDYDKYEVVLWTKSVGGEFEKDVNPNVEIRCWNIENSREKLMKALYQGKLVSFAKGIIYRICLRETANDWVLNEYYEAKAQEICDETPYDAVIAYQGLYSGVVATALYRLKAPVKIAWIHGEHSFSNKQLSHMGREYLKFDYVICVSESIEKGFGRAFPGLSDKLSVIYNLLDREKILRQSEETAEVSMKSPAILTVGRISKPKGQIMVSKVMSLLREKGHDVYWYLVGDGEMRSEVEAEIERYDVADRVILLGTKINPYPYIKNCDIYVQPSFTEGYCTTTVEAKVLCKPIVTTDAPGMREQFVSGENGLIVDAMTPEALAEGIRQLLDHPEMCEKFTNALKNESFDNAKEMQKLYDFIES